jgi:hypothetical protein
VLSGSQYLDASAAAGASTVVDELTGGPSNLFDVPVATATPTRYGWIAARNTTGVLNGTYMLQSVASAPGAPDGVSAPVTITVAN